ncbi:MAG: GAF domain-containing sensor histidine kinase [Candidatus Dormibacteraeota bacterium]|nr:GAF domain-containing sensor histidine kinase [Candidatus Dormibacteraeota bacterium]
MMAWRRAAWTAGGLGSAMLVAAGILAVLAAGQEGQGPVAALNLLDVGAVLWVGVLLTTRRPDNAVGPVLLIGGLLASLLLLLTHYANYALLAGGGVPGGVWAVVGQQLLWPAVYFFLFALLPLQFPDGHFLSPRWRWLALGLALLALVPICIGPLLAQQEVGSRTVSNPIGVFDPTLVALLQPAWTLLFSLGVLAAFGSLLLRYRRSGADRRQQIRWVAAAVGLTVVVLALQQLSQVLVPAAALPWWTFSIPLAAVPVSIGVAILRHRLFDIDIAIRRSLVFGILWLAIVLVYAGLASALGLAAGQRLSVQAAVVVTIGATIVFQPARRRLETLADRLAYGRRAGAYELLRDFGAATQQTLEVTEIGPRLAGAAREGMGAQWALVLVGDSSVLGVSGEVNGPAALSAPIVRREERIGAVECGPRMDGGYTRRDAEVLSTLARQAALAIQNAGLTAELVRRVDAMEEQSRELVASRSRIVQAQEAERRRIERDLHDGVQQQLISLAAGIRLARNRLKGDPESADAALSEVQDQAVQAGKELRELVRGIRPPILEDAGLLPAIEAATARLPLRVTFDVDEAAAARRYPAEVESAAYFVACEALTNVMKHAGVAEATIRLRWSNGCLALAVADAGRGFDGARAPGSGLAGLRDRVAAVRGELRVDSQPAGGTRVEATLPAEDDG